MFMKPTIRHSGTRWRAEKAKKLKQNLITLPFFQLLSSKLYLWHFVLDSSALVHFHDLTARKKTLVFSPLLHVLSRILLCTYFFGFMLNLQRKLSFDIIQGTFGCKHVLIDVISPLEYCGPYTMQPSL